jgi:hypothetical protein
MSESRMPPAKPSRFYAKRFTKNFSTSKSRKGWRSISRRLRILMLEIEFRRGKFKTYGLSTLPKELSSENYKGN